MAEPKIAQKAPFVIEVDAGNYAWCACGASHNQPYCDGSHRGSGIEPMVVKIEEKKQWLGVGVNILPISLFVMEAIRICKNA